MSKNLITGLHHVTAMASDPQANLEFYTGILGLRLVKKTINFDSPNVYHLYFGDDTGSAGTIMTFFPIPGIRRGRKGPGQLTVTAFSIPENAVDYWVKRFEKFDVQHNKPEDRFGETYIYFEDNEGLGLELVTNSKDENEGFTSGPVPAAFAIKSFHAVTLNSANPDGTARLLTGFLDYEQVREDRSRIRYGVKGNSVGFVDILRNPQTEYNAVGGSGTVHHLAFGTHTDQTQLEVQQKLSQNRYQVTDVRDRQYFNSIYFREPGGILFEVATLPPGFLIDESIENLGTGLKLPPWEEGNRRTIENGLQEISVDLDKYKD